MASKRKSVSTGALDLTTTNNRKRPKEQPEPRSRRSADESQHHQHFAAAGDGRPIVPRYKGGSNNATGRLPPARPQQTKDPGPTNRSRGTVRKSQQLGSPALNSLRLVPIPDHVIDRLGLLNRFDERRGPLGLLRFRQHRAFTTITEGLFSYTGVKAIVKREPVVKAGGHGRSLDPMSWLLDDDERVLKPLKAPKSFDLQALSASEAEPLEVGDFGPIIFGPTADDVDWGSRNVLGKFLLTDWAHTVVDSLMPLAYMPIKRTDLDLSQASLAKLVYLPCPSAPLVEDMIGGELDPFIQELLEEDTVMLRGLKETLCAEPIDDLDMDAGSKLPVDPFGSSEACGHTLLKMLVHETEPGGCRAPRSMPLVQSSLAGGGEGESVYDEFMSTLFEPSMQEPLFVPAAPYMNLLLDEDLDGSDYGDVLGTLSKFKLPSDDPWPLFPNVSLASAVLLLLNFNEGLDVKPLEKRASSSRQERSLTLTPPVAVMRYLDAQELKLGGMRDMPEPQSLLPRLVQLLNSEMVDFELGAGTKALLTLDGQWSFRGASERLDEIKPGFGDFIPLAIYNSLAGVEAELMLVCATMVDEAYALCRKEPLNLDIEHRYVLDEPLPVVPTVPAQYVPAVRRVNARENPPEPPADAMQVVVETPTVAKPPRSSLQQDDLLGVLMSTVRVQPTARLPQPSARMAQRAAQRKQTQHAGAAPVVEREPEPLQVKPMVPRRLLASERILELMDDLVLELLEHQITLVDAPFAEVDLICDERTACCLLGLGDMKTADDARILKDYIEGIMALSGCFETIVLILIGDPVESRAVIRRIHLALINTPVELILRTCQNATELSRLIRVIVDESIRRREERMTYDQDNWLKTTSEVTSQATFLSLFPSINYWVACLMLSSLPLRQLLSSPANTLHSMFPSVPSEWLTDFAALTSLEWREPEVAMDVIKDDEDDVYMTTETHGQWQPEYAEASSYNSGGPSRKPARVHLSHRPGDPQTRLTFAPL